MLFNKIEMAHSATSITVTTNENNNPKICQRISVKTYRQLAARILWKKRRNLIHNDSEAIQLEWLI